MVSCETAVPLAGTSSRIVIEYETLGAVAMTDFLRFPWFACRGRGGCRGRGNILRWSHLPAGSR
ncbi:hypothetical protein GCM10020367_25400 [Streptomyces sannanensis]|uniref:Uncharacterized protein n=1 Tax=Streptomyces sannanensis TaxID=285536 RepID=A0ABP6SAB2_9ACTN